MEAIQEGTGPEKAIRWLNSQPQYAEFVRACYFDEPVSQAAERYHRSSEWMEIQRFLGSRRGAALDVGAGRGISAYAMAKDGWRTTALEPDPSSEVGSGAIRRLVSETGVSIEIVESWGESLPFESNSFDVVHCRQVLHHARDLDQFCREAARVLRPGGVFIATREHVLSRREDLQHFLDHHPTHYITGVEHAYLLSDYLSAIRSSGIHLEKVLNPMSSDINLCPQSKRQAKASLAKRVRFPLPDAIPDWMLAWAGNFLTSPGRIYSFVGRKVSPR